MRFLLPFRILIKTLLSSPQALRMIIGTTLSFAFSIAVILSTIGLMDGFEDILREGLRKSSGDLILTSESGFFDPEVDLWPLLKQHPPVSATMIHESEAFIIKDQNSKGLLIRGIEPASFSAVTGVLMNFKRGEIVIGESLAQEWGLKKGDQLSIVFAEGHPSNPDLPLMDTVVVGDIIKHGIYEKDLRIAYLHLDEMQKKFQHSKINLALLKVLPPHNVEEYGDNLRHLYGDHFRVRYYWQEFSSLIEAVEMEKFSITLILQLIVLVAIFNIAAMTIYFSEKRSQDFFLVQALGLSSKDIISFWVILLFGIWAIACGTAYVMAKIFDDLIQHLPWLKIPGDIYVIDHLYLSLGIKEYTLVYLLSLVWILAVGIVTSYKIKKTPIIQGLRMEQV